MNHETCYSRSQKTTAIVTERTAVVQEYFQKRVGFWLETVGKVIFGMKHYWVRYEFASGRGQIHAHRVAISSDQDTYQLCNEDLNDTDPLLSLETKFNRHNNGMMLAKND